jgi:hypothetical protein
MVVAEERRGFYRESYSALMDGYRKWLGELPEPLAQRIAWRNAAELFGLE